MRSCIGDDGGTDPPPTFCEYYTISESDPKGSVRPENEGMPKATHCNRGLSCPEVQI